MGGQRRDFIPGIFEAASKCPEDLPLSILARRPHKELCPRKPARTKDVSQSRVKLRGGQLGVRLYRRDLESKDDDQMVAM